jgi:CheY-like chemotaxis protein
MHDRPDRVRPAAPPGQLAGRCTATTGRIARKRRTRGATVSAPQLDADVATCDMKKTILAVDDDLDTLVGLSIRLRAAGYKVVIAGDAAHAVHSATTEQPDLILLDLGMPGGNGFIVLDLLKSEPMTADIPVVVVSARDAPGTEEKVLAMGAVAFLRKPPDNAALLQLVGTHTAKDRPTPESA